MNSPSMSFFLAGAALVVLFVAGLVAGLVLGRRTGKLEVEKEMLHRLAVERDDAVKRSRAVLGGQVAEQVAPYLPDFPCDPQDVRFVGKPVDFVGFSGAAQGEVGEIVFIEVKSGGSSLSRVEKSIRDAVVAGNVRWVEYRIPAE